MHRMLQSHLQWTRKRPGYSIRVPLVIGTSTSGAHVRLQISARIAWQTTKANTTLSLSIYIYMCIRYIYIYMYAHSQSVGPFNDFEHVQVTQQLMAAL